MNSTQIGDISEQQFALLCMKNNIPILRPLGNNLPYDFIICVKEEFKRIQVKTAYKGRADDTLVFNTRSTSKNYSESVTKDYAGKIDYFAVIYDSINYVGLVPVEKSSKGCMTLYFGDDPKYNQISCQDFEFSRVLNNI